MRLAAWAFGHDHWETIGGIMRSVLQPYSRTAVKGCHASGKTFGAADIILLGLLYGHDVVTTAPTDDQVRSQIWRQVNDTIRASRIPLREWGEVNQTEIRLASGERGWGRATNQGVRFQGEHARPGSALVVIVDEGPGVLSDVLRAIEGMRAGGDVRVLIQGNPLVSSGHFYDIFAGDAPGWSRFTISAFDTPNLRGLGIEDVLRMTPEQLDENERPYLITRRYVREKYEEWGPDHWEYQARVLGQFPLQADDALLSLAWLEAAARREARWDPKAGPVIAGVDVAGPGEDETVVVVRQGGQVLGTYVCPDADARGAVLAALRPWRHRGLDRVCVDAAGIGHYAARALEDAGLRVRDINVGERPTSDDAAERYANLKAELYWALRLRFADGDVSGLTDRTMLAQLASIRYQHDARGRVMIEPKDKARARGVSSPDRAEALMLAFAPDDPRAARAALYGLSTRRG
ncbi:MAG TPA: hypothetical protein VF076_07200 [Acidimicrobiales bacterium]